MWIQFYQLINIYFWQWQHCARIGFYTASTPQKNGFKKWSTSQVTFGDRILSIWTNCIRHFVCICTTQTKQTKSHKPAKLSFTYCDGIFSIWTNSLQLFDSTLRCKPEISHFIKKYWCLCRNELLYCLSYNSVGFLAQKIILNNLFWNALLWT